MTWLAMLDWAAIRETNWKAESRLKKKHSSLQLNYLTLTSASG